MNGVQRHELAPSKHPGGRSMPASPANEKTASTTVGRTPSAPILSGDYDRDVGAFLRILASRSCVLDGLPGRAKRSETEQQKQRRYFREARRRAALFLPPMWGGSIGTYRRYARSAGLKNWQSGWREDPRSLPDVPAPRQEAPLVQAEKDVHEIDQGLFFNYVLGDQACGRHLCHAICFRKRGFRETGPAEAARESRSGPCQRRTKRQSLDRDAEKIRDISIPKDDTTLRTVETAVDLALLDPETMICVLRGQCDRRWEATKVSASSAPGSTSRHIYYGRLPYLWYLLRDHGLRQQDVIGSGKARCSARRSHGETIEKPWIAAVESSPSEEGMSVPCW